MFTNKAFDILSDWYKSKSSCLHILSQTIYFIIAHLLYWIKHGFKEISGISKVLEEMRLQGRKVCFFTRIDIIFEFIFYGFMTSEYLSYHFEKTPFKKRRTFYSEMDHWIFSHVSNKKEDIWKLKNKRLAYEIFKDYYKREQIIINSKSDFENYAFFASKHPIFFLKPYAGCGGVNSGWFNTNNYSSLTESFEEILSYGSSVLEEGVVQCEEMSKFNPDSINTVRIVTIRRKDKLINWFSFVRTGRKGCPVDNGGKGGIIIDVDINTGKMCSDGINELGVFYKNHPDTGITFKDFKLPFWNETLDMAISLMELMPNVNCIGWDFAITDNGPVVIEANGQTAFIGPQITRQKGIKDECENIIMNLPR